MPFSEHVKTLQSIDCRQATVNDRVKATLGDGRILVFRALPELADYLETPKHARLHLDLLLTPERVVNELVTSTFEQLAHQLPRRRRKQLAQSIIRVFCWSDNTRLWSGKSIRSELVAWIQWPDEPLNYLPNDPVGDEMGIQSVEFFYV